MESKPTPDKSPQVKLRRRQTISKRHSQDEITEAIKYLQTQRQLFVKLLSLHFKEDREEEVSKLL